MHNPAHLIPEIVVTGIHADFSPDNIAKQVPQLNKLLELREALLALKGPMGNIPAFRNKLQELIADPNARETLEKELAIILEKE